MVLVKTVDGNLHTVDIWGMCKFGSEIEKIFLTDGNKVTHSLSQYSNYLVNTEGIVSQPDGERRTRRIVKETVYGFRDLSENKKELLQIYEEEIERMGQKFGNKPDYKNRLRKAKETYHKLLDKIESKEVGFITLELTDGNFKISELGVSYHPNHLKKGVPMSISNIKLLGKRYRDRFRI